MVDLSQILDDAELERRIDQAQDELLSVEPDRRREKWEAMRKLILRRSARQRERMERERGLR